MPGGWIFFIQGHGSFIWLFHLKQSPESLLFSEKPLFLRTTMQEAPLPVFLFIVHIKLFLYAEIKCDRGRFLISVIFMICNTLHI